jgi:Tat protein secretion system quality control protein TatD with DNase activity
MKVVDAHYIDEPVQYFGPFKNKIIIPSFIPLIAGAIAQIKEVKETVADQISQNLTNFFKITIV